MALACPLASSSALATALSEFQAGLTNERKAHLLARCSVPTSLDVLTFTAELDRANAARWRRGVASRFCAVLESIQQYAAVMDTYSQVKADRTALIWGSVKFCIHVANSAASYYDKLSEWFMRLGKLCPRFSEWQSLFPHDARLRTALDEFYATVIRFCAKAIEVLDRWGIVNFLSTLLRPFELEFSTFEKNLAQQRADIDDEIRLASAQVALQEREASSRFRSSFSKNFTMWRSADDTRNKTIDKAKSTSAKQRLLDRLSSYDYKAALKENRKKRHGSSCSWLSEQHMYRQWLADADSSILWLYGGVGCGKSVLCAAIIDDLLRRHVHGNTTISFFFCKDNDAESVSAATILRSLTRQCLTTDTVSDALQTSMSNALSDSAPEPSELVQLFTTVSQLFDTHYVVIDGLNECAPKEQRAILDILGGVPKPPRPWRLKLFVACRDDIDKHGGSAFPSRYPLAVSRKHVDADIATYVEETLQSKIATGELLVGSPEIVDEVKCALVGDANGMFLWVAFQIADICEQTCDREIRTAIATLPKGLMETYGRILQRVSQRGKAGIARKVFRWAGAVRRPLTSEELHEAVTVETGQTSFQRDLLVNGFEHMASWCGNLVTVDEETNAVQFAHQSVKQYLTSDGPIPAAIEPLRFLPAGADTEVGEACVTYLCFSDFEHQVVKASTVNLAVDPTAIASTSLVASGSRGVAKSMKMLGLLGEKKKAAKLDELVRVADSLRIGRMQGARRQFSFIAYAREHWIAHTSRFTESTPAWSQFKRLVAEDAYFASLRSRLQASDDKEQLARYITEHSHLALLSSLRQWKPQLLDAHIDAAFRLSCRKSLTDLAIAVLEHAEANERRLTDWLRFAAEAGQAKVVRRLASLGADVNARDGDSITIMQAAAQNNHIDVVQELVYASANIAVNVTGEGREIILRAASRAGELNLIDLLIKAGATYETPSAKLDGLIALQAAAGAGNLPLAKALVSSGASATGDKRWLNGWTILQVAVEAGEMTWVEQLLGAGAKVNSSAAEDRGRTALQAAASSGNFQMLRLLLDAGAEVNAKPAMVSGRTALQAAAEAGHFEIAMHLLQAGADVNARPAEYEGTTALDAATRTGNMELTKGLFNAGATLTGKEVWPDDWTLLQAASRDGLSLLVENLLRVGADVNVRAASNNGRTALQAAAGAGNLSVVERLLDAGADVFARPAHQLGQTALQAAAMAGHLQIAIRLLHAGARVDTRPAEYEGMDTLDEAAKTENLTKTRKLVEACATLPSKMAWPHDWTLLQAAARVGLTPLVDQLLRAGADVNARAASDDGRTALQAAAGAGYMEIVERLLDAGADVNAHPAQLHGRTALQAAVEADYGFIATRLIKAGANVNAPAAHSSGKTAMQAAIATGNRKAVLALYKAGGAYIEEAAGDYGWTLLQVAAGAGRLDTVKLLLDAGKDVNEKPAKKDGRTALQAAAEAGHLEVLECLLKAGAVVNAWPALIGGKTALRAAAEAGHWQIVERLLDAGARSDDRPEFSGVAGLLKAAEARQHIILERLVGADDSTGRTALRKAAENGHLDVAEALVEAGTAATGNEVWKNGCTFLQEAAGAARPALVKRLVAAGANVNARPAGADGRTALQAAAGAGNLEIARHLIDFGAVVDKTAVDAARNANASSIIQLLMSEQPIRTNSSRGRNYLTIRDDTRARRRDNARMTYQPVFNGIGYTMVPSHHL